MSEGEEQMAEFDTHVLVVDDERFFREAIAETLEGRGFGCSLCESGEQALERISDPALGVVVLDIRLPGIDGIEVLRRAREARPDLRIIMLSASTDQELVLEALRLGACDYLAKPLHDEELVLAVRRASESFALENQRGRLRGRLDLLVEGLAALQQRLAEAPLEEQETLLQSVAVEVAAEVLGAEKTSLMRLDADGRRLSVVAAVGRDLDPSEMDSVALGEGIAGVAVEIGEPVLVRKISDDSRFTGVASRARYSSESFALAPLEVAGRSWGVLCVTDRRTGECFEEEDLSVLRLLAMQFAEQMQRAEKARAAESAVADSGVTQQFEGWDSELSRGEGNDGSADAELARLVCDAVVSEVEPQRVIDAVLRPLAESLDAAPVSIFLIDGRSGQLVLEGECDAGVRSERRKLQAGCGLSGLVLQRGSLVATSDPASDPRFDPEVDTPENGEVAPLLCLPLHLRGKVFGIFRAFLSSDAAPSARTGEVLSAALSAAIRNVLLYRSLVDSIAEVAEARRHAGEHQR